MVLLVFSPKIMGRILRAPLRFFSQHSAPVRGNTDQAYNGGTDLPKGLSPTTANQTAIFFLSLVLFGLLAVTVSVLVAAFVDAATFFCRRASINTFSFSGNPLFFAALLRALVRILPPVESAL